MDEEAAWAAIVAAYGEEPPDPPGARPYRPVRDLALPDDDGGDNSMDGADGNRRAGGGAEGGGPDGHGRGGDGDGGGPGGESRGGASDSGREDDGDGQVAAAGDGEPLKKPALGGSVVFAPGVGPRGPRDYQLAEPDDDVPAARTGRRDADGDDDGEGHFVPPEPPPLPEADSAAKFGWLGVIGGPVLMLVAVLLQWEMTWWLTTLCVGGFLGGFATLVARMQSGDDEDDDDPGRGAVV
ncbi:hypothetical protein J116_021225 [Streptomyces thermolilacinus SPC6]|uniref:Uncharacterized protein n=1 Tax=Streptomyces thermolilacinus SPC6 TaxID=1306406 RepID=A0A1D3E123_9ACTN|nr:hypothetical protein [Streptomyces thermolilacinus]OEJ98270.1 hypothetical protein J116_021225 [Streptomyces thermolilacinus SPC6]